MPQKKEGVSHHVLGRTGEEVALNYLTKKKYKIVTRGFRFHRGEIDIIAYDRDTLVFIEVKTRKHFTFGFPEEAVTHRKQEQIRKIAEGYLMKNRLSDVPCRFDILSIHVNDKEQYNIHHIQDAF